MFWIESEWDYISMASDDEVISIHFASVECTEKRSSYKGYKASIRSICLLVRSCNHMANKIRNSEFRVCYGAQKRYSTPFHGKSGSLLGRGGEP